jgi:hypothetical protein
MPHESIKASSFSCEPQKDRLIPLEGGICRGVGQANESLKKMGGDQDILDTAHDVHIAIDFLMIQWEARSRLESEWLSGYDSTKC